MMLDAGQMWLGIVIGFVLILVGYAVGAALNYGWGYAAGERDATVPARHRDTVELPPLGMSRLFEIPDRAEAVTQVIDHHAPDVFAAVPAAEYDLLTRPAPTPDADSPSNWTRRQALEMDAWIKEHIVEPSNVTQHLIQAGQR
jgi:hypothetical protein